MGNLTEDSGLRKLVTVKKFNEESLNEGNKPGVFGRLMNLISGKPTNSQNANDFKLDPKISWDLEMGKEIPLRRELWDEHRVLVIDTRVRLLEIPNIKAFTYKNETEVTVDLTVSYQVDDINQVARGSEDPLKQLYSVIIDQTTQFIKKHLARDLAEQGLSTYLLTTIGSIQEAGLRLIRIQPRIILPNDVIDIDQRIHKAQEEAKAIIAEWEVREDIDERRSAIQHDSTVTSMGRSQAIQKLEQAYQLADLDHDIEVQEKELDKQDAKIYRDQKRDKDRVIHDINIRQLQINANLAEQKLLFATYREMLVDLGFNPTVVIMMMEGDRWKLLYERIVGMLQIDHRYREAKITGIYNRLDQIISKGLSDETITQLVGWLQEESKILDGKPSPLEQFDALMAPQAKLRQLNKSEEKFNDENSDRTVPTHSFDSAPESVIDDKENQNDGETQNPKYPPRRESIK